jgi:hypothetical protein
MRWEAKRRPSLPPRRVRARAVPPTPTKASPSCAAGSHWATASPTARRRAASSAGVGGSCSRKHCVARSVPRGDAGDRRGFAIADRGELQTAAADVDHRGIAQLEGRAGGEGAEACLFVRAQHLDLDPRLEPQRFEQVAGVGGISHRGGGHGQHPVRRRGDRAQKALHGIDRAGHRFSGERPIPPRPQPRLSPLVAQDAVPDTGNDAHQHEARGVRSEVDERSQVLAHEARAYVATGKPR